MISSFLLRAVIASVSCLGLVLPGDVACAAGPASTLGPTTATTVPTVMDVRLSEGGVLRGRVVDDQGIGSA